ncbi:hypothetical protein ACFX1S_025697 [Malus domestica]
MATTFRWSGEHPQYSGLELCTLELNHYGLVENGVYKGGKIGVELGYNVDITQKVTRLIACIPGNRIVQLYYHDPTDLNTIGSQAFEVWPSLDSENYNGGTDEFKGYQYWPFIDRLANADNSVKKVNTYEAASVGIHGNIQEYNEDKAEEDNENNEKEGENE